MCGRYGLVGDKQAIAEAFHAQWESNEPHDLPPSYNIAPQSFQPLVSLNEETGKRVLAVMRWGLVPFWSKDGSAAFNTINARAETVATSSAFREPFRRRRCLVPAGWFYEWQRLNEKTKQPFAIGLRDGSLFAFAGLWDSWTDKATGQTLETYTVITTEPNELMEPIHNRMPVILHRQDYERWMATTEPSHLPVDLLRPYPAEEMKAWRVSAAVGNVRNNRPELIEPITDQLLVHQKRTGGR